MVGPDCQMTLGMRLPAATYVLEGCILRAVLFTNLVMQQTLPPFDCVPRLTTSSPATTTPTSPPRLECSFGRTVTAPARPCECGSESCKARDAPNAAGQSPFCFICGEQTYLCDGKCVESCAQCPGKPTEV